MLQHFVNKINSNKFIINNFTQTSSSILIKGSLVMRVAHASVNSIKKILSFLRRTAPKI